ncbi:MAG: hypothetical protein C0501_31735, partial [Isosphaera sp.]|nr:hypothetical protein [Isosphaera sp.]
DRVEFARAGKDGAGQSFNVKVVGGVAVTFNFSTNAGLPAGGGLSPSQVRCLYEAGDCDTAAMRRFAAVLRAELGWPADPPRVTVTGARPDPAGRVSGEPRSSVAAEGPPTAAGDPPAPEGCTRAPSTPHAVAVAERFGDTDLANAGRFVADHRDAARWAADLKRWLVFDGRRWAEDATGGLAAGLAHTTARRMTREAYDAVLATTQAARDAGCEAEEAAAGKALTAANKALAWAKQTQAAKRVAAMVEMAKPYLLVPAAADVFDRHPHLLNVPNGTVDLRTGELRPHDRGDFLTKLCPTPFHPAADAPAYKQFLADCFPDPAVAGYVRELSGYCATGEVSGQDLHLFTGRGSNGKGVLLDLWTEVLGEREYAVTAPAELVADGGQDRHPAEKAVLRGARLAACQETEDGEVLNARRVKALTGGNRISARGMRENFYSFPPTHTLILATNHLPRVRVNDHATWRRVRVVEFTRTYWTEYDRKMNPDGDYPDGAKADVTLPARLRVEAPGVLADMAAHAVAFYANGTRLDPPAQVARWAAEYRQREDVIGRFFRERVVADPDARTRGRPSTQPSSAGTRARWTRTATGARGPAPSTDRPATGSAHPG